MDLSKIRSLFKDKKYEEVKLLLKDELDNPNPEVQYILAMIYNEEKDFDLG